MSFLFPSSTITFDAALRDLASGSPKARASAAHALGNLSDPTEKRRAVDALVRALDDDRPEVRAEACASLGDLGEPVPLPQLVKRLSDGVAAVRQNAAIALGTLAVAEGFEPLAEALREGPADLRFQAATSLAEIDPARAFDHVVAALDDRDPQVVGAAALSVGAIASELHDAALRTRAIAALTPHLVHTDPNARFDIAYALADLGDSSGRAELAAKTTDPERAWDAVSALARIDAATELAATIADNKTPHEAAVLAAGRLLVRDPDHALARSVVVEGLTSRKGHVRGIAIEQLTEAGGTWAKTPLEKLARSGKGADLLEAIAGALRAISTREPR